PEARGLARDEVRLMVGSRGEGLVHARFRDLAAFLKPGDLVVINTSATMPAALHARREGGAELELHLSTPFAAAGDDALWVVELRLPHALGAGRFRDARVGETLSLPGGASAEVLAPYATGHRLWLTRLTLPAPLHT